MATREIVLTSTPQQITSKAGYVQALGSQVFNFSFSETVPTNLAICHTDNKIYHDGTFGKMWAWKTATAKCTVSISEAI